MDQVIIKGQNIIKFKKIRKEGFEQEWLTRSKQLNYFIPIDPLPGPQIKEIPRFENNAGRRIDQLVINLQKPSRAIPSIDN